jgi:hypothetical protein
MARTKKQENEEIEVVEKKKPGRKPKLVKEEEESEKDEEENEVVKPGLKKRGRKPKGGKIVQQVMPTFDIKETKTNIILHLKCSLKDLNLNENNMEAFSFNKNSSIGCEIISQPVASNYYNLLENQNMNNLLNEEVDEVEIENVPTRNNNKDIWKKLKALEQDLHLNNNNKKSACFWCTYDFDNPSVHIPKFYLKESYHVYGCFCSPECATAFLMNENIDSSTKFERYHMLNHIYSQVYDYKKSIKPAPNPFYTLEKYCGNLNINEYRSLLSNERLFLVVDKPLTKTMPELHEDNDDFIINNKIIPSNTYKIKKKSKPQTKNSIMSEKFGLNS